MKLADWLKNYKHVEFEDVRTPNINVYSIYDNVTKKFGYPIVSYNDDSMLRDLSETLKKDTSNRAKDLSLYHIGYWNEDTALIQPCVSRCLCENLSSLLN